MFNRIYKEIKGRNPEDITDYVQKLEQKNQGLMEVIQRSSPNDRRFNDRRFWTKYKTVKTEGSCLDLDKDTN